MNSTFKVVFNKARGALMVVNEVTSSVQAKGTKTVIAAAVAALVAGGAVAADTDLSVWAETNADKVKETVVLNAGDTSAVDVKLVSDLANTKVKGVEVKGGTLDVKEDNRLINWQTAGSYLLVESGTVNVAGTKKTESDGSIYDKTATIDTQIVTIKGGTVNVGDDKGSPNYIAAYKKFDVEGGTINLGANTRLTIGGVDGDTANTMTLKGGVINLNGTSSGAATIRGAYAEGEFTGAVVIKGTEINVASGKYGVIDSHATSMSAGSINVTGGDLQINNSFEMTGGAINVTGGQVRINTDATITDGTLNLSSNKANLELNSGAGYPDGVGLVVGDQDSVQNLTLGEEGTKLVANVKDGAHIDAFGNMTITGGTFNVGGELYGSTNNTDNRAWRQGSQIYAGQQMTVNDAVINLGQNSIFGGETKLEVKNSKINVSGTRDAVAVIGAWGEDGNTFDGSVLNVTGAGVVDFDATTTTLAFTNGAELNVAEGGVLYVTADITTLYDTPAAGATQKGTITLADTMKGLIVNDGTVTLTSSDAKVSALTVGKKAATEGAAAVSLDADSYLKTGDLTLNKNGSITNAGELEITGDVTVETGAATSNFVNTGAVYTKMANLAKKGENGAWTKDKLGTLIDADEGYVFETASTANYTIAELQKVQEQFNNFAYENGALVTADGKNETWKNITDNLTYLNAAKSQVDALPATGSTESTIELAASKDITIGSVNVGEAKTLAIAATGDLTIAGGETETNLFAGTKLETVTITGTGLTLGAEGTKSLITAKVNVGEAPAPATPALMAATVTDSVVVEGTHRWTNGAAVNGAASLFVNEDASLTVTNGLDLSNSTLLRSDNQAAVYVTGDLTVDWVKKPDGAQAGTVAVAGNGAYAILGKKDDDGKALTPGNFAFVPADDATLGIKKADGALLSLGADLNTARAAIAKAGTKKNAIYVARQIDNGGEAFGQEADIVINMVGVASTKGYKAEDGMVLGSLGTGSSGVVYLQNFSQNALVTSEPDEEGNVTKSVKVTSAAGAGTYTVDFGTYFYDKNFSDTAATTVRNDLTGGSVELNANDQLVSVVFAESEVMGEVVTNTLDQAAFGQNELIDRIVWGSNDYIDSVAAAVEEMTEATADEKKAFVKAKLVRIADDAETVALGGIAGGAFSTAVDINNENTKALARRMSAASGIERADGINVWVDVVGTTNQAKNIFGDGEGYEADIYGAVFGADWTAPCGAIVGAALNIGQADANSKGIAPEVQNDVDYYGISVYGAHQVGLVNGMFDIGYTKVKNDLSTNTVIGNFSEKLDGDMFTVGLGAEYLAKAGAVNVVPHAGIRYTRVDMDNSKFGTKYDAMGLFQMPIGVTFSGAFETAGWTLAPKFDITVAPAFGDKNVDWNWYGVTDSVRVVDSNPVQATLGLSAQTGAWTFGVNYSLTAGSNDRMNNSFSANARYTF